MADAKTDNRPDNSQSREPAKGGTKPAHENAYPSGDSPKPHGDKLEHAADEAAQRKRK
jgi:hypothetical protein